MEPFCYDNGKYVKGWWEMENEVNPNIERKVIPLWSLTVWLVVMNTTMFNVALPSVIGDFQLTPTIGSIIVSGYSIAFAIATITYSRLSDFIPIRMLLITALVILGVASMIGYIANTFSLLVTARLLQAVGAGAVPGLAMVLAARYISLARRGRAMSLISSAASLGFGLGPVVGGSITQWWGWNALFLVTTLVLFLLPWFKRWLPVEEQKPIQFDLLGAALTAFGVAIALVYLVTFQNWLLILSLVTFYVLWKHIHRPSQQTPFIQPQLLRQGSYLKLLFIGFSAFSTHFAILFLMPIMLAVLYGKSPAAIGLIIFPGAMLSAFAAIFIGKAIDRWGNQPLLRLGHLLLGASTLAFAWLSVYSPHMILITYMLTSIGFTCMTASLSNEVSRILDKPMLGSGMGLMQLIQFFGGAFGVTAAGLFLDVQKELSPEVLYRNVFMSFSVLILFSFGLLSLYLKKQHRVSV
ncbi:MFS transporter [Ammoniphilus sp. YIM 78166]|uniref:MFS transporter n=1 Tax=Ammoniphilus sp. YIM 78166 TaxID=1644106 RepID=UPI001F10DBFA|nr:MFS transporter [Ammoniphilus sp. YIM 78166]